MELRILGAHTAVSESTDYTSSLIDDILAIDAGSLAARLSFKQQQKLKAVLLTHEHIDHIRDIHFVGWNLTKMKASVDVYAAAPVCTALLAYMKFIGCPDYPDNPALRIHTVEPGKKEMIEGYQILPVAVNHAVPATGFQVTSPDGKKVFFTGDTGPGLADVWRQVSPHLLISELTFSGKDEESALKYGHLTPSLLRRELESFRDIHNYLPKVVLTHLSPFAEKETKDEIRAVEKTLKIKIIVAHEGMKIKI